MDRGSGCEEMIMDGGKREGTEHDLIMISGSERKMVEKRWSCTECDLIMDQ